MEAPSQGGELVAWIHHQMTHSEERIAAADFAADAAFHRGVVMALREVLAGLRGWEADLDYRVAVELDDLRNRVAVLEAAKRWYTVAEKQPPSLRPVLLRRAGVVRVAAFCANDICGIWAWDTASFEVVVDASEDDRWCALPEDVQ